MSRAFVKDDDDRPERPPARAVGDRPNYVTAQGLRALGEGLVYAEGAGDAREAEYYRQRVNTAIVKARPKGALRKVAFGCTVTIREGNGNRMRLRIVGEDEADPRNGSVSWVSPYAQALLDRRVGDRVVVARPAGSTEVTVETIVWQDADER